VISNKTLERVSLSYRSGYQDGYAGREQRYIDAPSATKPFGAFDYAKGYAAGKNDAKWDHNAN
jgi:hypothetical protein